MMKIRTWLWEYTFKPTLEAMGLVAVLFGTVGLVVGSMFGIAWMVDELSIWCFLLYIPWILILATVSKRFDKV